MKIESSELISSESIFHSLDVSITNSVFCHTISTRTSDSLVLSIAMSNHHWTNGLPFSLVHDSGIPSLIPEIRLFHKAKGPSVELPLFFVYMAINMLER